jgi:hypothetical protein
MVVLIPGPPWMLKFWFLNMAPCVPSVLPAAHSDMAAPFFINLDAQIIPDQV